MSNNLQLNIAFNYGTQYEVKNIIETDVNNTSREFVLKLKLEDENTLGIIIKITKGLIIPPEK